MSNDEESLILTLPDATAFNFQQNQARCYTVIKNSSIDVTVTISLIGTDEWYLNRGYSQKVLTGAGEEVTIKNIKIGSLGYWVCIDDIISELKLTKDVEQLLTVNYAAVTFNTVAVSNNPQIMSYTAGDSDIVLNIQGIYDISYTIVFDVTEEDTANVTARLTLDGVEIYGSVFNDDRIVDDVIRAHIFVRRVVATASSLLRLEVIEEDVTTHGNVVTAEIIVTQKDVQS